MACICPGRRSPTWLIPVIMKEQGDPEIIHKPCSEKKGQRVLFVRAETLAQAALGMAKPEIKKKPGISAQASEEIDKEFERRKDWSILQG